MKILFLEDNPDDVELIQRTLRKGGLTFVPLVVHTREAFTNALNVFKPHVILSDHSIPQFDSTAALSLFKETGDTAVFILVTGTVSEEFAAAIIKQGADDYVLKSNLDRLPVAIERALTAKKQEAEKKDAEQQLAEKNLFLSLLMDSLPVISYLLDPATHKALQVHGNVKELTGYNNALFISDNFWAQLLHPDDVPLIREGYKMLEEDKKLTIEYRLKMADQSYRWFQDSNRIISLDGKSYISGILIDITNRKISEMELTNNKARWRSLIENSSDIITLIDKDGTILYKSSSVNKILGYSEEGLIGKNMFELLHPDDIPMALEKLQEILREPGSTMTHEFRFPHNNGNWLLLEVQGSNLLHDPHVNAIVLNSRDITERKRIEEELEAERIFLKTILDNINVCVLAFDSEGKIVLYNRALAKLQERVDMKFDPNAWLDHMDIADDNGKMQELPIVRILQGESVINEEVEVITKESNKRFWLLLSGSPLHDKTGTIVGAVMAVQDISDLKKTEERLRSKMKDLDTYIYRTSHDLKGPLSSVQGLVNLARDQVKDPMSLQILEMVGQCNARLEEVLSGLTEVTQVLNMDISYETVDLREVVNNITSRKNMPGMQCAIDIGMNGQLYTDKVLLRAILDQLIDNSVKYRKPGFTGCFVNINVSEKLNHIHIRIEDNGRGIPLPLQEKVFEMFFRGADDVPGIGLGLYLVRSAVEKLGGSISLTSQPRIGTVVNVMIPKIDHAS